MSRLRARAARVALLVGASTLLGSCAVTDGGYGYNTDVRIGLDYYDPWFGDYGDYRGWGPGYRVGPPRQNMPRPEFGGGRPSPGGGGGYRPAPGAHAMPSLPSRPHGRGQRPGR